MTTVTSSSRMRGVLCALAVAASSGACQYDVDKIYEHAARDAGSDGAAAADASMPLPATLIDLWQGQAFVDADCVSCAKKACAAQNTSCRNDSECGELTRCLSQSTDPATHASCRSDHLAWLSADISGRAVGGPYYNCVFRDKCAEKCAAHTDWSCLGQYSWDETSEKKVSLTLRFTEALNGEAAAGLNVKVCAIQDIACTKPTNGANGQNADADGVVALSLPTPLRSFSGYLELTGTGWYPTLVHFGWPLAQDGVMPLNIISQTNVELNIQLAGVAPDPTRGLLQIRVNGCGGVGMRDIAFHASKQDASSRTWYAKTMMLPEFDAETTGDLGNGGIINVPAGINQVTAVHKPDGKLVAHTNAPVRAGYMTIVVLAPLDAAQ